MLLSDYLASLSAPTNIPERRRALNVLRELTRLCMFIGDPDYTADEWRGLAGRITNWTAEDWSYVQEHGRDAAILHFEEQHEEPPAEEKPKKKKGATRAEPVE